MCALRLEIFDMPDAQVTRSTQVIDTAALEDIRMQSYEQGYTAGWDDAASIQTDDQHRIKSEFARNLQSLGFTFQEARIHVLRAVYPLIEEIVSHLLPEIARKSLASIALETLTPMINEMADAPITLVINPVSSLAVTALLEQVTGLSLTVVSEPTLGEGQVYLRLGDIETQVDLDLATAQIATAVHNFFEQTEKDKRYG